MKRSASTHSSPTGLLSFIMDRKSQSGRHVKGEENPADDASKGLKLDELLQNERWLKAPSFLWKSESEWPGSVEVPPITEEDPEVRRGANIYATVVTERTMESLLQRYSTWWGLIRAFGWLSRFKDYLKMKVISKKNGSTIGMPKLKLGNLQVNELKIEERNVVRCVQRGELSQPRKMSSEICKILEAVCTSLIPC